MPSDRKEAGGSKQSLADILPFGGVAFALLVTFYLIVVVLQTDDRDFVRPERFFPLGLVDVKVPLAAGTFALPGLNLDISLGLFFFAAPFFLLAIHYGLLDFWSRKEAAGRQFPLVLRVLIFILPMLGLVVVARQYFPFATVRPSASDGGSSWLTFVHASAIAVDVFLVLFMAAPDRAPLRRAFDPSVRGGERFAAAATGCLVVLLALSFVSLLLGLAKKWESGQAVALWPSVLPLLALAVAASALCIPQFQRTVAGLVGGMAFGICRAFYAVFGPRQDLTQRKERFVRHLGKDSPMRLNYALRVLVALAALELALARSLDLAGATLAADMPAEIPHASMVAAYMAFSTTSPDKAWESAREHAWGSARGLDLSGWHLASANLRGATMPKINLVDASLTNADMAGANLFGAVLNKARLQRADLRDARLGGVQLIGAVLTGSSLQGAQLQPIQLAQTETGGATGRTDFTEANLTDAVFADPPKEDDFACGAGTGRPEFSAVVLRDAIMTTAKLPGFAFPESDDPDESGVDLRGADLSGAVLVDASFVGWDLTVLKSLRGADLRCADLSGAILDGIDLANVKFEDAVLAGAKLIRSKLQGAQLQSTRFSVEAQPGDGGTMERTDFTLADLTGAVFADLPADGELACDSLPERQPFPELVLRGAIMKTAKLPGFAFSRNNEPDQSGIDLRGADLSDAVLVNAEFAGWNFTELELESLRGADFRCADLKGASLSGMDLTGAQFQGADLTDADLQGATLIAADFGGAKLIRANLRMAIIGPPQD